MRHILSSRYFTRKGALRATAWGRLKGLCGAPIADDSPAPYIVPHIPNQRPADVCPPCLAHYTR